MKTIIPLLLLLASWLSATPSNKGREYDRKLERAETLYRGGNYPDALNMYLELYRSDTSNYNVCYKAGVCYLKTGNDNKKALSFLKKAAASTTSDYIAEDFRKERNSPPESLKLLGDAYHLNYEFDQAISTYEAYKALVKNSATEKDLVKDANRKIEMCKTAKQLMSHPAEVKIVNLGPQINSPHADYSPRLSADQSTMIFTSRRPENVGGKTYDGGQYFEDIYIATKKGSEWQPAVNMGSPVNTVGNEAAIGISADGQEILIYKDDMGDGNIYSSRLEGDTWSVPVKLNSNINSQYWEPGAFLSADGQTLYFVSDRPGGYGGTDLYKSRKTFNGDWGKAINLGPTINSPYDEHSPYIHPDGRTLFFSSKGHNTMGGYDVFFSHTMLSDERAWVAPTNVGYPINTPGDDAFYMVSPDKQCAYYSTYSSFRNDGIGEKDNYMVTFADVKETPLTLVKGAVMESKNKPAKNVVITVTDNETNLVEGVYHTNSKTGNYLFILTPGKNHNITYESDGQMFYSENRLIADETQFNESANNINLPEVAVGSKIALNNIFFDFDNSKLRPGSMSELHNIYEFLRKNPRVTVEVAGYADPKGSETYNKKLSKDRAQSVVNFLHTKGIDKRRMVAVGYGEATETDQDKNALAGGGQMNRRVELKITAMK
jgi:outer membrane protein OmpA-like peptidoglycan-associated protein